MIAQRVAPLKELDHGWVGSRLPTASSTSTNPARFTTPPAVPVTESSLKSPHTTSIAPAAAGRPVHPLDEFGVVPVAGERDVAEHQVRERLPAHHDRGAVGRPRDL